MNKPSIVKGENKYPKSTYNDPEEIKRTARSTAISMSIKYLVFKEYPADEINDIMHGAKKMTTWMLDGNPNKDLLLKRFHALDEAINTMQFPGEIFQSIESLDDVFTIANEFMEFVV